MLYLFFIYFVSLILLLNLIFVISFCVSLFFVKFLNLSMIIGFFIYLFVCKVLEMSFVKFGFVLISYFLWVILFVLLLNFLG